jgi:hypothetical protein
VIQACFVTVCGGGEEYEYLLGSIDHHARLGRHLVLDTTPADRARTFRYLPGSVTWVHEPDFGAGWDTFKFVKALNRAAELAEALNPDVLIQLDCDDFFTCDLDSLLPVAKDFVVELQYVHWMPDGKPYIFGESEWHRRVWPANRGVRFRRNFGVSKNPEVHPELEIPSGMGVVRSDILCRHHAHFAVGEKAADSRIAQQSITGWPHGKMPVPPAAWPDRLMEWRETGKKPSEAFL